MADYTHFDAGTFAKWLFTKIKGLLSGYVKTSDSRLSDARKASDVSAWAKASTKPTYTAAEVGAATSSHNHDSTYLKLSGGTMTGQLLTSFKNSVATGSYQAAASTVPDLIQEVRYSSGCMGSAHLTTAYNEIPAAWYNFLYIPHRSGGVSGAAYNDNCDHGTLLLFGMTTANQAWVVEFQASKILGAFSIRNTDTTYGIASQSSNGLMSAADKKAVDREFFRMAPKGGTVIPNGANLNSTAYLKVGNYYQSVSANTANMTNIPIKSAFMMYVLSPLSEAYDNESTGQWVYRLRIFVEHTGSSIFTQKVSSGATAGSFTYNPWIKLTNSNDLGAVSNKSAKYTLTASNWSGTSAPYTYDLGSTYGNNSIIGFDSAVGNATQLEAAMSANIQGSSTTKIYAYGDKPTVDIPIIIQYS